MNLDIKDQNCQFCATGKTIHVSVPCDECLAQYDEDEVKRDQVLNSIDFFEESDGQSPSTRH